MKVYLASDLGFTDYGKHFMYQSLIPELERAGVRVINPWDLTDTQLIKNAMLIADSGMRRSELVRVNGIIAENNILGIRECETLVALLDGMGVDDGVAAEIGYAFASGKKIFGLRTDVRLASDNEGSNVNLQVEYFIVKSGGSIERTVEGLIEKIRI